MKKVLELQKLQHLTQSKEKQHFISTFKCCCSLRNIIQYKRCFSSYLLVLIFFCRKTYANKVLRSSPRCFIFTSSASIFIITKKTVSFFFPSLRLIYPILLRSNRWTNSIKGPWICMITVIVFFIRLEALHSQICFFSFTLYQKYTGIHWEGEWENWLALYHMPRCGSFSTHGEVFALKSIFLARWRGFQGRCVPWTGDVAISGRFYKLTPP